MRRVSVRTSKQSLDRDLDTDRKWRARVLRIIIVKTVIYIQFKKLKTQIPQKHLNIFLREYIFKFLEYDNNCLNNVQTQFKNTIVIKQSEKYQHFWTLTDGLAIHLRIGSAEFRYVGE